jgi:hypothetical protein
MLDKHSNECYNMDKHSKECAKGERTEMKDAIKRLWADWFSELCAECRDGTSRALLKKIAEKREAFSGRLSAEQLRDLEEYTDAVFELESLLAQRAFRAGCSFSVSFLLGAMGEEK